MKDHLLSIFPLQGMEAYARVSCIALGDTSTACIEPFTTSRAELNDRLVSAFAVEDVADIFRKLDSDVSVQFQVTEEQARGLGLVAKLN